ncbi:MAG TPA: cyclohexa-1,5-dienecarbonyl-CoA hydratase [Rhodospirillales bacterium]|nr:cyclohexa-1,5-dienecarbonyl-CoA hydratase [Rhodospirillales bacterium]
MTDSPLKIWRECDDRLLRLRLDRPKANIIDGQMIAALDRVFSEVAENPDVHAILLDHSGPHFSFGASVEEHLPQHCAAMLKSLHGLIRKILTCPAPVLVAVGGQCLGGGLELALAGNLIFVAPEAALGQPEIKLAVFAPAASCLLPRLAGQQMAEDMLLSGRSLSGDEAVGAGIARFAVADPAAAALDYYNEHLAGLSASSLRYAVSAARQRFAAAVSADLDRVETLYLNGLMNSDDAPEGLQAFSEKRTPRWRHS